MNKEQGITLEEAGQLYKGWREHNLKEQPEAKMCSAEWQSYFLLEHFDYLREFMIPRDFESLVEISKDTTAFIYSNCFINMVRETTNE